MLQVLLKLNSSSFLTKYYCINDDIVDVEQWLNVMEGEGDKDKGG